MVDFRKEGVIMNSKKPKLNTVRDGLNISINNTMVLLKQERNALVSKCGF